MVQGGIGWYRMVWMLHLQHAKMQLSDALGGSVDNLLFPGSVKLADDIHGRGGHGMRCAQAVKTNNLTMAAARTCCGGWCCVLRIVYWVLLNTNDDYCLSAFCHRALCE